MDYQIANFFREWWNCAFSGNSLRETATKMAEKIIGPIIPVAVVQIPGVGSKDFIVVVSVILGLVILAAQLSWAGGRAWEIFRRCRISYGKLLPIDDGLFRFEIQNEGNGIFKPDVSVISAKDDRGNNFSGIPLPVKLDAIHGTHNSTGCTKDKPEIINFIGIPKDSQYRHYYLHGESKHVEVNNDGKQTFEWRSIVWYQIRFFVVSPKDASKIICESTEWIRVEPHDDSIYPYYKVEFDKPPFLKSTNKT